MIEEIGRVLLTMAAGEVLSRAGQIPVPGPVIALVLLYGQLVLLGRVPEALGVFADRVLQSFGLYFVPAGVGVIAYKDLLRTDFAAIVVAVVAGTLVTIFTTALVAAQVERRKQRTVAPHASS